MCFANKKVVCILLALVSLSCVACGNDTTGNSDSGASTLTLSVPYQASGAALGVTTDLPGMLRLVGADGGEFVSGTVQCSNGNWQPAVKTSSVAVDIVQSAKVASTESPDFQNLWKLRVSDSRPFGLRIHNGQAEGHWNFSGLRITALYAELGAAKNAFTFDEPNPVAMESCELHCGKGEVVVEGIPYASCRSMVVVGGDGSVTLRFGTKEMLRGMDIKIQCGSGPVSIVMAPQTPARVVINGSGQSGQITWTDGLQRVSATGTKTTCETALYSAAQDMKVDIEINGGTGSISLSVLNGQ